MSDRTSAGAVREWHFEADDSGVVRRAYAFSNRPGRGYGLLAEVACDDEEPRCAAFQARLRTLPAPRPIHEAAFDSESVDLAHARYASWIEVLRVETCTDQAPGALSPQYPPAALREGAEGVVHVQIAFNRCGHIRDASVRNSSGNRHLDRAAVNAVRSWSMGREANAGNAGLASLPVNFSLADDSPQPVP